ncbi:MAG: helix-turn-helix domain-containing protein [Planctomycetes bacterium]|nr:helix-turn-helix domain-containing protein [Planctomycetota bacterium]
MNRSAVEQLATSALGVGMVDMQQLADHLGVHVGSIKRWRHEGKLPPADFELGGIVRWSSASVERWIRRNRGA